MTVLLAAGLAACHAPAAWRPSASEARARVLIAAPRLGVMNVLGHDADSLVTDDLRALTPLFGNPVDPAAPPVCDVLLLYCRLDAAGTVVGTGIGLDDIVRRSQARIVVVATENTTASYIAAGRKPARSTNLVMTLQRKGPAFDAFFARLFELMFTGDTMPVAWVKLAPQEPHADPDDDPHLPSMIFVAGAGPLTFR